jgi:hypothetical protein
MENLKRGWYWVKTSHEAYWQIAFIFEDYPNQFVFSLNGEDGSWNVNELVEIGQYIPIPE